MMMTVIMLACGAIVLGSMPDVSQYKTDDARCEKVLKTELLSLSLMWSSLLDLVHGPLVFNFQQSFPLFQILSFYAPASSPHISVIVVHRGRLRRYWKAIDNTAILYLMTLSFLIAVICVAGVSLVKQYTDPESKEGAYYVFAVSLSKHV